MRWNFGKKDEKNRYHRTGNLGKPFFSFDRMSNNDIAAALVAGSEKTLENSDSSCADFGSQSVSSTRKTNEGRDDKHTHTTRHVLSL